MNWLKYLVGFSALIIAGCAAYFSVTGLGVLFSGAAVSVMVMAGALEFAKLVAATYLKQEWENIKGFNKWYLTSAVALLMLITSAGIFGYLSNAFQSQSLKLQQVDREVLVYTTKIDQNTAQITQLNAQLGQLSSTQNTILDKGKVNSRLLRSIDQKDRQTAQINKKIEVLQTENAKNNEKINEIKTSNLDLEKEVGGFRFIAEAFGMELKNVVKFFIFLIVIVFDPLAVALIIAFNGLISIKNRKQDENLTKNVKIEEPIRQNSELVEKKYQIYGDSGKNSSIEKNDEVIVENIVNETEKNEINEKKEDEPVGVDDVVDDVTSNIGNLKWEEWMHPEFPWQNRKLWINNAKAVNYWLASKGGTVRELSRLRSENENIKTY
jgi:glucose dehydrogenase